MTHYWFKPKRYGYGATPMTWQGWAVTIAAVIVVVAVDVMADGASDRRWLVWVAVLALLLLRSSVQPPQDRRRMALALGQR